MKVAALDLATRTGVAIGVSGGAPRSWTVDLGETRSQAARFSKVIRMVQFLHVNESPDLLAIEAPIGGKHKSDFLIGLWACAIGAAHQCSLPYIRYDVSSVRKHFLGKNLTARDFPAATRGQAKRAIKGAVVNRCRALGWVVADDNCADASALWDYAISIADSEQGHRSTPLFGDAR